MAMYCPFCQIQLVGRIGRYCASCGKDIQFLASALADGEGQLTGEMREAALFQKHHSQGQTIEGAEDLVPGDLIEIFRVLYRHWAVYVGGGDVVHLVALGVGSSRASSTVSGGCVNGQVRKDKLQDVIGNDKWKKNNIHDKNWKPRSKNEIMKEALSMVGEAVNYNITSWNCEHFATMCRYGKAKSLQVLNAAAAGVSGSFGSFGSFASSFSSV